jgi:hypothetical protein
VTLAWSSGVAGEPTVRELMQLLGSLTLLELAAIGAIFTILFYVAPAPVVPGLFIFGVLLSVLVILAALWDWRAT